MKNDLYRKMSEIMGIVGYIQKGGKNDAQDYTYASAEQVLGRVNQACSERGICVASDAQWQIEQNEIKGKVRTDAFVKLQLKFCNADNKNEMVVVTGLGSGSDYGDKALMKANTAAIKYALTSAFLISWGDDPEATNMHGKSTNALQGVDTGEIVVRLLSAVEEATSVDDLTKLRPSILKLKNTDGYDKLTSAFKARKASLSN